MERIISNNNTYSEDYNIEDEFLNSYIKKINRWGYLLVNVENFGWRKLKGFKYIKETNWSNLIESILPDTECSYNVDYDKNSKTLVIQNYHHDNPTGSETYTISSAKAHDVKKHLNKKKY